MHAIMLLNLRMHDASSHQCIVIRGNSIGMFSNKFLAELSAILGIFTNTTSDCWLRVVENYEVVEKTHAQ